MDGNAAEEVEEDEHERMFKGRDSSSSS